MLRDLGRSFSVRDAHVVDFVVIVVNSIYIDYCRFLDGYWFISPDDRRWEGVARLTLVAAVDLLLTVFINSLLINIIIVFLYACLFVNFQFLTANRAVRLNYWIPPAIEHLPLRSRFNPCSKAHFVKQMLASRDHDFVIRCELFAANVAIANQIHSRLLWKANTLLRLLLYLWFNFPHGTQSAWMCSVDHGRDIVDFAPVS